MTDRTHCVNGHDLTQPGALYEATGTRDERWPRCRICSRTVQAVQAGKAKGVELNRFDQPGNPELTAALVGLPIEEISAICSKILERASVHLHWPGVQ